MKPTSGLTRVGMKRELAPKGADIRPPESAGSGLTAAGLRHEVEAAKLSTDQRKSLNKSEFVFPDKAPGPGSCPIPDVAHAEKALQLCNPKSVVKEKVCSKFPDMPACKDGDD